MNMLVIIAMTCLLLLIIFGFDAMINGNNASGITNNNNLNYKLFTGTICHDKDNQVPFIPNENGDGFVAGEKGKDPLICWTIPDYGKGIGNLVGTPGPDIIYGKDGLDVLQGKEGDDILDGGNNDDSLFGGDGNDELFGSINDDQMFGGNGDDRLVGSFGNDYIIGGNGRDELSGNQGNDVMKGGAGPDFFDCGDDIDIVIDFKAIEGDTISQNCENTKQ